MSTEQNLPRVVIAGGGFGGLNAARALKHAPVEIVLIDRTTQRGARVIYVHSCLNQPGLTARLNRL